MADDEIQLMLSILSRQQGFSPAWSEFIEKLHQSSQRIKGFKSDIFHSCLSISAKMQPGHENLV